MNQLDEAIDRLEADIRHDCFPPETRIDLRTVLNAMKPRVCPACGMGAARLFREARHLKRDAFAFSSRKTPDYSHHRLLLCEPCDLVFASPVQDVTGEYVDAAFDSEVEAAYASRTYGKLLHPLLTRLPSRGAALDIGTGDGSFLFELKHAGFERISGVEPSKAPVAAAHAWVRPLIVNEFFQPAMFVQKSFDLITCFQTLEHLADPALFLRNVLGLLKPGGMLMLVTHNRRAATTLALGRRSPVLDIEHLQLFSPRSLQLMLGRAGFTAVATRSFSNCYPLHYWARLLPLPPRWKLRLKSSALGNLRVTIPAGNICTVAFKPF